MTEHPEKRMKTDSVERALIGLSQVSDMSVSEFVHLACLELVIKRTAEAKILIEALGIK